jgi:hypothetical protein
MSLLDQITSDMKDAMKAKEADKLSTLRMAKAALMNEQNKNGVDYVLSDEEIIKVLQTLVKQRRARRRPVPGRGKIRPRRQRADGDFSSSIISAPRSL